MANEKPLRHLIDPVAAERFKDEEVGLKALNDHLKIAQDLVDQDYGRRKALEDQISLTRVDIEDLKRLDAGSSESIKKISDSEVLIKRAEAQLAAYESIEKDHLKMLEDITADLEEYKKKLV